MCLLDSLKHNMHKPVANVACSCKLTPCLTTTSSEMMDTCIHAWQIIVQNNIYMYINIVVKSPVHREKLLLVKETFTTRGNSKHLQFYN